MEAKKQSMLLVDDEKRFLTQLIRSLKRRCQDFEYNYATTASQALDFFKENAPPDVVVVDLSLDVNVGPESGIQLISKLNALNSNMIVIVLTGHDLDEWGGRAIDAGASSCLSKPANVDQVITLLKDVKGNSTSCSFGNGVGLS